MSGGQRLPVVEHFYSLQGEGYNSGKACYFIRLAGCKVGCSWCDSKISWSMEGGEPYSIGELASIVKESGARAVVITGGEPLLHNLTSLTDTLKGEVELYIESSGTEPLSGHFEWITLSPKRHKPPLPSFYTLANEVKVIIEGRSDFEWAESCRERAKEGAKLFLQPEWSVANEVLPLIVEYIKANPHWRLSLQSHKYIEIP